MKSVIQLLVALDLENRRQKECAPQKPIAYVPTEADRRAKAALERSVRTHIGNIGRSA